MEKIEQPEDIREKKKSNRNEVDKGSSQMKKVATESWIIIDQLLPLSPKEITEYFFDTCLRCTVS